MYITWLGHACFKIAGKFNDKDISLVTDPYYGDIGFKLSRIFADMVTVSSPQDLAHNNYEAVHGTTLTKEPFLISNSGEYEFHNIYVLGNGMENQEGGSLVYRIEIEGISLAHVGKLPDKNLSEEMLSNLQNIDVLFLPIGGKPSLSVKDAVALMKTLEPRIVIPMMYKIKGLKLNVETSENFVKEAGLKGVTSQDKLRLTKKDLVTGEQKVIFLDKI